MLLISNTGSSQYCFFFGFWPLSSFIALLTYICTPKFIFSLSKSSSFVPTIEVCHKKSCYYLQLGFENKIYPSKITIVEIKYASSQSKILNRIVLMSLRRLFSWSSKIWCYGLLRGRYRVPAFLRLQITNIWDFYTLLLKPVLPLWKRDVATV